MANRFVEFQTPGIDEQLASDGEEHCHPADARLFPVVQEGRPWELKVFQYVNSAGRSLCCVEVCSDNGCAVTRNEIVLFEQP